MNSKFSVLIPDGESLLTIYIVNCLSLIDHLKIYVLSNTKNLPIRASRHVHRISYYPKTDNPLDWITRINQEVESFKIDLIMPIFEEGIETLIRHKKYLNQNKLVFLSSLANFQIANNKLMLSEHLWINNIPHPKTSKFSIGICSQKQEWKFPVIVKPSSNTGGGRGVHLCKDKDELCDYAKSNSNTNERIIQEYIEGYDVGCSVLCKDGSILAYTIQKASMLEKNPFKPLLEVEFIYNEDLLNTVKKLMESLNWSGVAHIDLRFDKKANLFKVIEINPRFWGSLNASLAAGVNFPYLYCLGSMGQTFKIPEYSQIRFLNFKGLSLKIFKNIKVLFDSRYILNQTEVKYILKDPAPILWKYVIIIQKNIVSIYKKVL
ncbi:ATP-grasp domain-containing protein [Paucihalobacter ruber]|uniref:ATP-grasp domain-containing protein n=1 Tax=Paucihalobacter ruber TaxID=2567861 RepID=A0A506PGK4_9FLAO|nr:ATP-grasp domain-containing protein [Paucihalobacter ruber]TPV32983.1 ATP-grasp domain-containing protein [Paucihalobacter ruber]